MMETSTLISTLCELIQIPSVNPAYADHSQGPGDESLLADFLEDRLSRCGAAHIESQLIPGGSSRRRNVYAYFKGESEKTIGWDIHMDTVGIDGMNNPFLGACRDNRVYGRGSVDTKASFAIALDLLARDVKPKANILLAATCGEETGGEGARAFSEFVTDTYQLDQLIIAEPTECAPAFAQKGALWLRLLIPGRRGHSANPEGCLNPTVVAGEILGFCRDEQRRLRDTVIHSDFPTLEVTSIHAGRDTNSVPDTCEITLDRRLVPGETTADVLDTLSESIRRIEPKIQIEKLLAVEPLILADTGNSMLIKRIAAASGMATSMTRLGTNASFYTTLPAKEAVIFGPGSIAQAHQADEWVSIEQLEKARAVIMSLLDIA